MVTFANSNPSVQVINHIHSYVTFPFSSHSRHRKTEMVSPALQFPGSEAIQSTSMSGPPDPPNTPVPRMHPAGAPDANQLELRLAEALDRVQNFNGPGDPARSPLSGSTNGPGERIAVGDKA